MGWNTTSGEQALGRTGSEGGQVVRDEVHDDGYRITLEKKTNAAPWAITFGGGFVHTTFASTESEAARLYEAIRSRLEELARAASQDEWDAMMERLVGDF